jgi:endoglucanase
MPLLMKTFSLLLLSVLLASLQSTAMHLPLKGQDTCGQILLNQLGYYPLAQKIALLKVKADSFEVVEVTSQKVVFTGKTGPFCYWEFSGDSVSVADFSAVASPGNYQIRLKNQPLVSPVFSIGKSIYAEITKAALKAFYLNRSGMAITQEFAGKWARPAGHPDTAVIIHASASSLLRPQGTFISSTGGWYDAGDYNKYVVNSAITTYTLLLFNQLYPDYCQNLRVAIPESSNNRPDVMDELLVNLRWMLTMQDPSDGGVYHKLTNKTFCGFIMPHMDTDARYVVAKSTAASLDFAATMALAYRVLGQMHEAELNILALTCLGSAKKAYQWAIDHPTLYYKNPNDISTGAYDDTELADEFFWASCELALAENNPDLLVNLAIGKQKQLVQSWDCVQMLGIVSLALSQNNELEGYAKQARGLLTEYVDGLVKKSMESPYRVSLDFFKWGSNSDVANMAMLKLVAHNLNPNGNYLKSVQSDVDYLLGRNATGYCFVTGFGHQQAMNIHHRPSGADGVAEPCPGFLVGGPNTIVLNDCQDTIRSIQPAKSFVDLLCSYSTNEVAINWNAPLFFVLGALESLNN